MGQFFSRGLTSFKAFKLVKMISFSSCDFAYQLFPNDFKYFLEVDKPNLFVF